MSCWSATRRVASSRPSALWPTSPGRHQPSWRHRRPVPGAQGLSRDVGPGHAQLPGPSINGRPRHPGPSAARTPSLLELLRASPGAEAVEPAAANVITPSGPVRVDVIDVIDAPDSPDIEDPTDRLYEMAHAWAFRTATELRIDVLGSDRQSTVSAVARVAEPGPLVAMKPPGGIAAVDGEGRHRPAGHRHDPARPGGKGCRPGAAGGVRSSDRRGRRAPRTSMVRRAGRPDSQTDPRCGWPRDRTRRGSLSWPTSSRPRPVDSRPAR